MEKGFDCVLTNLRNTENADLVLTFAYSESNECFDVLFVDHKQAALNINANRLESLLKDESLKAVSNEDNIPALTKESLQIVQNAIRVCQVINLFEGHFAGKALGVY